MSEQFPFSFGKYRMEAEIGRGGFGNVFRAVDVELDRPLAIKILDPMYMRDQRWVTRFRREARVMARLEHPHIVPIYEIGEQEGRLYLAMRLIDGPDLTEVIEEKGALPWDEVVAMVSQVASALDYAHQHDVIHRDLKPGNILLIKGQAMLTDFGLAQMMASNSQSISVSGGIAGTYNYMPPEIFKDEEATPAADVYGLGCVVYEMLTGKMLFDAKTTAAIIGAHLEGVTLDVPLPEGSPPGTREILQTALARDPLDRYASAGELAQELQRVTTDRLTVPYAQLEQSLAEQHWPEALALAAEIRDRDPNYRDVAALEERAQRGQLSAQWRTEAEEALAEDNFSAVRGALMQWRRVDPDSPEILRVEEELALAEQYVKLQKMVSDGQWEEARTAANAIYAQDHEYRDIVALQVAIRTHLPPSQPPEPLPQTQSSQAPLPPPAPAAKGGLPRWAWWIGALAVLIFAIWAVFFRETEVEPVDVTALLKSRLRVLLPGKRNQLKGLRKLT